MGRNKISIWIYLIIGLAAVGLVSQLFTNTAGFLSSIFVMMAIGLVIFALIYFIFLKNRGTSNEMKKYKQAVKQSKTKYTKNSSPQVKSAMQPKPLQMKRKTHRRTSHLRVIDGSKSKRKNRANL